ncbi:maleylpyruvate isomerase N-terminal domain-containing protein [Streptomyces sp. NPDC006482]|uniref:maleylpyruvate isomerase N-terminal domain-containing protein n=1 Tax=Streptomyces sp. NPDC006482 TaxID=3154306 RepID=UPI0033B672F4
MLDIIEEVTRSGARITATLDALTDLEMRAPSTLAGWTRGHVITHLARSIDAYGWLLAVARTGIEPVPRTDAKSLARTVREGADRPAAELATDLRSRLEAVRGAMDGQRPRAVGVLHYQGAGREPTREAHDGRARR